MSCGIQLVYWGHHFILLPKTSALRSTILSSLTSIKGAIMCTLRDIVIFVAGAQFFSYREPCRLALCHGVPNDFYNAFKGFRTHKQFE